MLELKGFENDVEICHVGNFLRLASTSGNVPHTKWLLDIKGYPFRETKKTTSLSNLPILARGRFINSTKKHGLKPNLSLKIKSTRQFQPVKLADYSSLFYTKSSFINKLESQQWGYRIMNDGVEIIFPQLEMARSFLLVNSYLSRACMGTTLIDLEFDTEFDQELKHFTVHFTKASSFPFSVLESTGMRKMLSWLLFNTDAMNSFKSIYRYYVKDRLIENVWEKWTFRFDLPDLSGWEMALRGRYLDKGATQFFVEEIMQIAVASPMPRIVTFTGDMLTESNVMHGPRFDRNTNTTGSGTRTVINDDSFLDDDTEPNSIFSSVFYADEYAEVKFRNPFTTTIKTYKKGSQSNGANGKLDINAGKSGKMADEQEEVSFSTQESHIFGNNRQADLGVGKEDEKKDDLVAFEAFAEMVRILSFRYGWAHVKTESFELKKEGRSRLHNLKGTKVPRQIKLVVMRKRDSSGGKFVVGLLELDTSDGVKAISTKLLQEPDLPLLIEQLEMLKTKLVKNSLSWPNDILNQVCGTHTKNKSLVHQKQSNLSSDSLSNDEIENWAKRANKEMSEVRFSVTD